MAGQIIKLKGVTAAATMGLQPIEMSAADSAAVRINQLSHVVSARTLSVVGGLVSGRSRRTGAPLVLKGTQPADVQLKSLSGRLGIGLKATSSLAALALPAGSATPSYSAVAAVGLPGSAIASANTYNVLYSMTAADVGAAAALRYYGSAGTGANPDKFVSFGSDVIAPSALAQRPAGDWMIVAVDFNDSTMVESISVNGAAWSTAADTTHHVPGEGGYFAIGYAPGPSLRDALLGDLFLFNDTMLSTSARQGQIAAVIAGLKADYGIS